ncbi:stress responsive alpha/beta barrel protein [Thermosporothrix hazakensis]|jgi:antibiotic biosynthesis monooxygenase (ABM) superfamily enzyme|uniref:Stress responsive alpha/beta barrel protein n=2 Tax=Thermosporothrix TaxID=768650 RepID=A0A326TXP1_THEHA|nr:Dabb family protein [Thermosporothrix hazakensis]PZW21130.1 stress responsive alpha/beta barrel protein [Thermosporothrix hazakensis]BBH91777.1 stress protein [Thermosporothrix sp. COM3]GCE50702.1 stress protein [Thermosporothrix hazakensis]
MIQHIVLLQPKEEATEEEIQAALEHVKTLQEKIPGILSIRTGKNLNTSNNHGFTYGFVMEFADVEHLKAYAPHPEHKPVSVELRRLCTNILDFDLTSTAGCC